MDVDGVSSEKIAILDAGAQYSKLIDRFEKKHFHLFLIFKPIL